MKILIQLTENEANQFNLLQENNRLLFDSGGLEIEAVKTTKSILLHIRRNRFVTQDRSIGLKLTCDDITFDKPIETIIKPIYEE